MRPLAREQLLLGGAAQGESGYVLFDELASTGPVFTAGQDRVDGLHFVTATIDEVARFVARRQLRLPREASVPHLTRAAVEITDAEAWRLAGRGQAVVDLRLGPVGEGGPSGTLACAAEVTVDGARCATASAQLAFGAPARPAGRRTRLLADDFGQVRPARVGCADARDVVVHGRLVVDEHRVLMDVVPHPDAPAFDPATSDRARDLLLVEASRQAATLAAAELRGLSGAHCVLTRWFAEFHRPLETGAPLRCSALPGRLARDARDRPVVPVRIEFIQGERCVGTVTVAALQDC